MTNPNLAYLPDLPPEHTDPTTALFHVIPIPYDTTSTWHKGADRGPRAILEASAHVEWYDIQTRSEPHSLGVATHEPIIADAPPEQLAEIVESHITPVLTISKIPVVLGGEHSVSIGAIRAAAKLHPNLTTLQIDAHADTREAYMGSACNHACVMARAREVSEIVQVGIRSMDIEETERLDGSRVFFAHDIVDAADDGWMDGVCERLTEKVYLTIDLDAFDPGVMAATGTPEPGGLDWGRVNRLIEMVSKRAEIVGFDVVELCPTSEHWACDFLAAKMVHRVMAMIGVARQ